MMAEQSKAELLLHPIRLRVVLALAERPRTALQLGRALPDVAQATLYRHLAALLEGGLLAVVGERQVRSNMEKIYGLAAGGARLGPADIASATPDDHRRYFALFVAQLLHSFERYLEASPEADLAADGVSYNTGLLQLSDDELREAQAAIRAVIGPLAANEPGPGRRRRQFALVLMPAPEPADNTDEASTLQ